MAWTAPTDRSTGYVATAADWNVIQDDLTFLSAATGASVVTSETTASTSYGDLATTGPAVTVTTGTKALVLIAAQAASSVGADAAFVSFTVTGASSVGAADLNGAVVTGTAGMRTANPTFLTGLTAGSNTFTAKYRAVTGGTATFSNRWITVIPLP